MHKLHDNMLLLCHILASHFAFQFSTVQHSAATASQMSSLVSAANLCRGVTRAGHKTSRVWRQAETHHVTSVTVEWRRLLTSLNVPQCTANSTSTDSYTKSFDEFEMLRQRLKSWNIRLKNNSSKWTFMFTKVTYIAAYQVQYQWKCVRGHTKSCHRSW